MSNRGEDIPVDTVQRTCVDCDKAQEEPRSLQAKLTVGPPGDHFEQEADRVADQVANQLQGHSAPTALASLNNPPTVTPLVMRQPLESGTTSSHVTQGIESTLGTGEPMPPPVRTSMECALGARFDDVRVHTGNDADALNQSLHSRAFTTGRDIYFKSGEYQPASPAGQKLLAHELTHVVQQRSGRSIQRQTATPARPPFAITQIPGIMTAMSWTAAAALLNDWFSRPSNATPSAGAPNTSAVTVGWTRGFSRAQSVYNDVISGRIWANSAAQTQIQSQLVAAGLPAPGASLAFGSVSGSVSALHPAHVNFRSVNQGLTAPLDGLAGALANFGYYVVVAGTVTDVGKSPWYSPFTSRRYRVDLPQAAVYIRDSFDFNGDQDLGCWDPIANTVGRTRIGRPNATCVDNATFRAWRAANGAGGDFFVYSDLDVINAGDSFEFNV